MFLVRSLNRSRSYAFFRNKQTHDFSEYLVRVVVVRPVQMLVAIFTHLGPVVDTDFGYGLGKD